MLDGLYTATYLCGRGTTTQKLSVISLQKCMTLQYIGVRLFQQGQMILTRANRR